MHRHLQTALSRSKRCSARRIADRDRGADCPKCGETVTRVAVASPHVSGLSSLHERDTQDGRYARLRHAAGCGCCV